MLASAPRWPFVWPTIKAILRHFRRVLVYNAAFDHRLLAATAQRYGLLFTNNKVVDSGASFSM